MVVCLKMTLMNFVQYDNINLEEIGWILGLENQYEEPFLVGVHSLIHTQI